MTLNGKEPCLGFDIDISVIFVGFLSEVKCYQDGENRLLNITISLLGRILLWELEQQNGQISLKSELIIS